MAAGVTLIVTVGCTAGPTVTSADAVTVPPGPVQVIVYVFTPMVSGVACSVP
jgi:hypothetical protein